MLRMRKDPPFDPVLSFPAAVQDFVRDRYAAATRILEYGSGGSTLLAASLGKPVVAVESDASWADKMNARLARDYPEADARVVYRDIGKTGAWGKPLKPDGALRYFTYPMSVWDEPEFADPDLILIDGRFRVACFCTALLRLQKPATILFDDYLDRDYYHSVEKLVKPVEIRERMAVFEVSPGRIPPQEWTWVIGSFFNTTYTKK
jgi:hypothetical protein